MKYVDNTKKCQFCASPELNLNYKNIPLLLTYVDYFGKIKKSYYKGTCRRHQAELATEIKHARHMALMSFVR